MAVCGQVLLIILFLKHLSLTFGHGSLSTEVPVRSPELKLRKISTTVGDHVGIPSAECFALFLDFSISILIGERQYFYFSQEVRAQTNGNNQSATSGRPA